MNDYKNIDINELLSMAKSHDDAAFSEIAERYMPMIRKVALGFLPAAVSTDELINEALVALHRAVASYKTEQVDVSFGLYARICVYNKLLDVSSSEKSHEFIKSDIDIENVAVNSGIQSKLERQETVDMLKASAARVLSDYENRVFSLCLAGYKTAEISKILGKSAKSVDNAKARMLKTLREKLDRIFE